MSLLRISSIETPPSSLVGYSAEPGLLVVTANQPIGVRRNQVTGGVQFYKESITLDRVLAAAGVTISIPGPEGYSEVTEEQLLVERGRTAADITVDGLNRILSEGRKPDVRTVAGEFPGIIYAHRNVVIGNLTRYAVQSAPGIISARIVHTSTQTRPAEGVMSVPLGVASLYPQDTLLAALAEPGVDMGTAMEAVRSTLML